MPNTPKNINKINEVACFFIVALLVGVCLLGCVETLLPLVGRERKHGIACNFFIFMVGTLPGHCPNISAIEGGHFLVKHGTPSVPRQGSQGEERCFRQFRKIEIRQRLCRWCNES